MRLGRAERVALQVIGGVALIALVAIAPGMGVALKHFGVHKRFSKSYVPTLTMRLKQKGYITYVIISGKKFARLTQLGRTRLVRYQKESSCRPQKQARWDGKWRIVTFDIPERYRRTRDQVRYELKEAGFVLLHKSVWVTPYPCEEFVTLLKADQHIGRNLLYIVADKVEHGDRLKKTFDL